MSRVPTFASTLKKHVLEVARTEIEILQVNIGRRCNQACHHCHVESGPLRTENMEAEIVERIIELLKSSRSIHTVDVTGGAPELNPNFRTLVKAARELNIKVMDRCNLTVFFEEDQGDTPQFLKDNRVHVIASLPCYSRENVERQRGRGVFGKSIEALKMLNALGYGFEGSGLTLDLVYNPTGPFLPPAQEKLESDYKRELKELFGIEFNRLYTITNMPIKRFLIDLEKSGQLDAYMDLLVNSFNAKAASSVMCRNLVSVSWNGEIFDCDFNQMLELPAGAGKLDVWDIGSFDELNGASIRFGTHCYGCTAGSGSSCGGALT